MLVRTAKGEEGGGGQRKGTGERGRSRRSCKCHGKVTAKRGRSGDTAVVNPMRSQALFIRRATRSVSRKMRTSRLLLGTYRFYDRTV